MSNSTVINIIYTGCFNVNPQRPGQDIVTVEYLEKYGRVDRCGLKE